MITQYTVVMGGDPYELRDRVNEHISDGWQPHAGPLFYRYQIGDGKHDAVAAWGQAMVKQESDR